MRDDFLPQLQLLHFADSAVPIGAVAHSFGLEMLVADGALTVDGLYDFLVNYLTEWGTLEAAYCRAAHRSSSVIIEESGKPDRYDNMVYDDAMLEMFAREWLTLNQRLSALKPARESRVASATLGRRLLQLAAGLQEHTLLYVALDSAKDKATDTHYATAFGLIGGVLGVDATLTVLAYLQQAVTGLLSACQRLMPLGQTQAAKMSWALKSLMLNVAEQSAVQDIDALYCFTPCVEVASMRHPTLETRLFIS